MENPTIRPVHDLFLKPHVDISPAELIMDEGDSNTSMEIEIDRVILEGKYANFGPNAFAQGYYRA
jgi:hypothetical protein